MTLTDTLCAHADPVVAYRARRRLAGESERSPAMRRLRRNIGASAMARDLLRGLNLERWSPYRKWQGPHWTLYSLAEIGYPPGDRRLLPLRQRVLEWMFSPAFLKPPSTAIYPDQPERPRRCASMEGNLLEGKRLADGMFPVEWTNVKRAPRIVSRGTYADWGPLQKKRGNPLVTIDALYVLREAGRS